MTDVINTQQIMTLLEGVPSIADKFNNPTIPTKQLYREFSEELDKANFRLDEYPKLDDKIKDLNTKISNINQEIKEANKVADIRANSKEYIKALGNIFNFGWFDSRSKTEAQTKSETKSEPKVSKDVLKNEIKAKTAELENLRGELDKAKELKAKHEDMEDYRADFIRMYYPPVVGYLGQVKDYLKSKHDVYNEYSDLKSEVANLYERYKKHNLTPIPEEPNTLPKEAPDRTLESNIKLYETDIPNEQKRLIAELQKEPEYAEKLKRILEVSKLTVPPTKSQKASRARVDIPIPAPQVGKTVDDIMKSYRVGYEKDFRENLKTLPHDEHTEKNKDIINRTDYVMRAHPVFSTLTDEASLIIPLLRAGESAAYDALQEQYARNINKSVEPNDRAYIEQKYRWLESPEMQKYRRIIAEDLNSQEGAREVNNLIEAIGRIHTAGLPDSTNVIIQKAGNADENIKKVLDDVLSSNTVPSWDKVKDILKEKSPEFYKETYLDEDGDEYDSFQFDALLEEWKAIREELKKTGHDEEAKRFKKEVMNVIAINRNSPVFAILKERLEPFKKKTIARNYIRQGIDSSEAITKAQANIETLGKKQDVKIDTTIIKETPTKDDDSKRQSRIRYMRRQAADVEGSKSQQYQNSSYKTIDEDARKIVQRLRRNVSMQPLTQELTKEPTKKEEVDFTKLMMLHLHQRQTHEDMDYQPVQLTSEAYIRS